MRTHPLHYPSPSSLWIGVFLLASQLGSTPHAQAQWYRYAPIPLNAVARDVASDQTGSLYMVTTERDIMFKSPTGPWTDISHWGMIDPMGISAEPQGGHIYVGSRFQGLFRTANNGASWNMLWMQTNQNTGHHEGYLHFAHTPTPGVFFASQVGRPAITRFTNFGAAGQEKILGNTFNDISGALHYKDGKLVVSTPTGIRLSTDQGNTFTLVAPTDGDVVAFTEDQDGRVFALLFHFVSQQTSLLYSDDMETWSPDAIPAGLVGTSLWYDANGDALWLGSRNGVHRRAIGSSEWEPMDLNNAPHVVVEMIGDNLGGVYDFSEQYIAQRLEGPTWTPEVEGLDGHIQRILLTDVNTVLAHSTYVSNNVAVLPEGAPGWSQVYLEEAIAGVRDMVLASDGRIYARTARTLYRSEDGGATFEPTTLPDAIAAQQLGMLGVLATGPQGAVFVSHTFLPELLFGSFDQGATWSLVTDISGAGAFASIMRFSQDAEGRMYTLQVGPHTEQVVRPFHTTNGGTTWQEIPFDNGDLFPFTNHQLQAFGSRTFLVGGVTVYEILPGSVPQIELLNMPFLHTENMVNTFKLTNTGRMILHSWNEGVYVSDDDGATWDLIGHPTTTVDDTAPLQGTEQYDELPFIIIERDNDLGIEGGVYYHLSGTTAVNELSVAGIHAFPNPTTGPVSVNAATPIRLLEVRDAAGRLLLTRTPNTTRIDLDLHGIATGLVFLHLRTDDGPMVQRLLITAD